MNRTFINKMGSSSSRFNDTLKILGKLYTYHHELSQDGIVSPTIDEQKEIEKLAWVLLPSTILKQISVQHLQNGGFAYTYVFKSPILYLDPLTSNVIHFLSEVSKLTKKANHFYATPIKGTRIVIGTFILE